MNSAQSETGSSGFGKNGEDLDVVLGRFQNWAATQLAKPAASTANKSVGGSSIRDAREVSYEQALRASSYRRPADPASLDPMPPDVDTGGAKSQYSARKNTRLPEAKPESSRTSRARFAQAPPPEARFADAVRAVAPEPVAPEATAPPERPQIVRQIEVQSRTPVATFQSPARAHSSIAEERVPSPRAADPQPAPELKTDPRTEGVKPKAPQAATSSRKQQQRPQPAFRDVLKGTAALVAATQTGSGALERGKATSLTMRVSDGEQARIQACAAQANLSVSAYLRQCALGVDELRDQVEMALAKLREQQGQVAPPPGLSAIPGILGRFAMKCVRRMRGQSDEYTVVSIR